MKEDAPYRDRTCVVDPYLFPARGRKPKQQPRQGRGFDRTEGVDPYLFPARGRKPKGFNTCSSTIVR